MATDPFDGIQKPIKGGTNEIGQPTFVELIWAKECEISPAVGKNSPDVELSLRKAAFGKDCIDTLAENVTPAPEIIAKQSTDESMPYRVNDKSHAYQLNADKIKEQRLQDKLRSHIHNDYMTSRYEVLNQDVQLFAVGLDTNCANYNGGAIWDLPGTIVDGSPHRKGDVTTVGSNGGPSAYGTYDQSGNVWEWCDRYYTQPNSSYNIPLTRGGDYASPVESLSSAIRAGMPSTSGQSGLGFRIASRSWPGSPPSIPNPLSLAYFVNVADVGNNGDSVDSINSGYGKVDYLYAISQYTVTNYDYARFLNAVASVDTYGLYNPSWAPDNNQNTHNGGIVRTTGPSGYIYSVVDNMADKPISGITWWSCARYCNWLHNGMPYGPQNASTTEDGAYTLNGRVAPATQFDVPVVNTGAKYQIPTEDEWYKAAYYKRYISKILNDDRQVVDKTDTTNNQTDTTNTNKYQPTAVLITDSYKIIDPPIGATIAKIWAVGAGSKSRVNLNGGSPGGGLASSTWPLLGNVDGKRHRIKIAIAEQRTTVNYFLADNSGISGTSIYGLNATAGALVGGLSDPKQNFGPEVSVFGGGIGGGDITNTNGISEAYGGPAGTITQQLPNPKITSEARIITEPETFVIPQTDSTGRLTCIGYKLWAIGPGQDASPNQGGFLGASGGTFYLNKTGRNFKPGATIAVNIGIPGYPGTQYVPTTVSIDNHDGWDSVRIEVGNLYDGSGSATEKFQGHYPAKQDIPWYRPEQGRVSAPAIFELRYSEPDAEKFIRLHAFDPPLNGYSSHNYAGIEQLKQAVELAGGKTLEDYGVVPAFGSGGAVTYGPKNGDTFTAYDAGIGGGGAKAPGSTVVAKAGKGAVVIRYYFSETPIDRTPCGRRRALLSDELTYALKLAGATYDEQCQDQGAFGSGASRSITGLAYQAGYGGGGITNNLGGLLDAGLDVAPGPGAVVILFTTADAGATDIQFGEKFEIAQIFTKTGFPWTKIAIPDGCTSIKAWAIQGGGMPDGSLNSMMGGVVLFKTWLVGQTKSLSIQILSRDATVKYNANPGAYGNGAFFPFGTLAPLTDSYFSTSLGASSPFGGSSPDGGFTPTVGNTDGMLNNIPTGRAVGGSIGVEGDDNGEFSRVLKLAAKTDTTIDVARFGKGGEILFGPLHGNTTTIIEAGLGGGGAKITGYGPIKAAEVKAGGPAVLLLFTGYAQVKKAALKSPEILVITNKDVQTGTYTPYIEMPAGCIGYKIWALGPGEDVSKIPLEQAAKGVGGDLLYIDRTRDGMFTTNEKIMVNAVGRADTNFNGRPQNTQVMIFNLLEDIQQQRYSWWNNNGSPTTATFAGNWISHAGDKPLRVRLAYASAAGSLFPGLPLGGGGDPAKQPIEIPTDPTLLYCLLGEMINTNVTDDGRVTGGSAFGINTNWINQNWLLNTACPRHTTLTSPLPNKIYEYGNSSKLRDVTNIIVELLDTLKLAGEKIEEDCGPQPAFGAGGGITYGPNYNNIVTAYDAGYGGGGVKVAGSSTVAKAGDGVVVIRFYYAKTPSVKEYWLYATQSDAAPQSISADTTGNGPFTTSYSIGSSSSANFNSVANWGNSVLGNVSTVGSNGGPSSYGTYDQDGNVFEWHDYSFAGQTATTVAIPPDKAFERGLRGGACDTPQLLLIKAKKSFAVSNGDFNIGFRIASRYNNPNPLELVNFSNVGDMDNKADNTLFGTVAYPYAIGKFTVTNCEYAEFLNNVAKTDTYNLYDIRMGRPSGSTYGGITRSGGPGSYVYDLIDNMGNKPVVYVNWFNCARYCNWLHNGKPSGIQNSMTTEDGAYTMKGQTPVDANVNAKYHLPIENEWYKAAYYRKGGINAGYWKFATQSDELPTPVTANPLGDGIKDGDIANITLFECAKPTSSGQMTFNNLKFKGSGYITTPCKPDVIIEDVVDGRSVNERQSIVIPTSSGGRWELSWRYSGQTQSVLIQYGATAAVVRNRFGTLSITGGRTNLSVTGAGTSTDPYIIEFINELGATNHRPITVDISRLIGSSDSYVTKIVDGSTNEQKTITNTNSSTKNFTVSFSGVTSKSIPYNASLNKITSILEGMSNIGVGNIMVEGETSDRDANYTGPYRLTFIGDYANQNVSEMAVRPTPDYQVVTDWSGGAGGGTNEKQLININAKGGTYKLTLTSPATTPVSATTANIDYNATATQIKNAITSAVSWLAPADIRVTQVSRNERDGKYSFQLEFAGRYARQDIPLAQLDNRGLKGTAAKVTVLREGYGIREQQRLVVLRAYSGTYRLNVTVNGKSHETTPIQWDETPEGVRDIIAALPPFEDGDVTVTQEPKTDSEQNYRYLIAFKRRFGNIPKIVVSTFTNTLSCNPNAFPRVPGPPYAYPLPECDSDQQIYDYQDGPLLCHPGDGETPVITPPCCGPNNIPNSANMSRRIKIERELFDPNRNYTIQQLATSKGLSPSDYTPYIRMGSDIVETSYGLLAQSKMSIILVHNQLNTTGGINKIVQNIQANEILPQKYEWPN